MHQILPSHEDLAAKLADPHAAGFWSALADGVFRQNMGIKSRAPVSGGPIENDKEGVMPSETRTTAPRGRRRHRKDRHRRGYALR